MYDIFQAEIEKALDELCALLPAGVSSQCDGIVKTYTPLIIQLLVAKLQPDQVCQALGLCSSHKGMVNNGKTFYI